MKKFVTESCFLVFRRSKWEGTQKPFQLLYYVRSLRMHVIPCRHTVLATVDIVVATVATETSFAVAQLPIALVCIQQVSNKNKDKRILYS